MYKWEDKEDNCNKNAIFYNNCYNIFEHLIGRKVRKIIIESEITKNYLVERISSLDVEVLKTKGEWEINIDKKEPINIIICINTECIEIYNNKILILTKNLIELIDLIKERKVLSPAFLVKGSRDRYWGELEIRDNIINKSEEILKLGNYKKVETPLLEYEELYRESIGESSDIIRRELYRVKEGNINKDLVLRPEGTLGVLRAVISNKLYRLNGVCKYWYEGKMYRFEKCNRSKTREFIQLGVECIGSKDIKLDVEVIDTAMEILKNISVPDLYIEINNIGNKKEIDNYNQYLYEYLIKYKEDLSNETLYKLNKNPFKILDNGAKEIKDLINNAPKIKDFLGIESNKRFEDILKLLEEIGIKYRINETLVRGIDYYTDLVFEIKGKGRSICGGGRYNNLIKDSSYVDLPGIGWSIGIDRVMDIIVGKTDIYRRDDKEVVNIVYLSDSRDLDLYCIKINTILRKEKIPSEINYNLGKLNRKLSRLKNRNVRIVIILGEQELFSRTVNIKVLSSQKQIKVSIEEFPEVISKIYSEEV